MKAKRTINFKDPLFIVASLDTALKKEKEKYTNCPVKPDLVPDHEAAQGWGYVVVGYFLFEEALKALLYVRKQGSDQIPMEHTLSILFDLMDHNDKEILREYYSDFRSTVGGRIGKFPIDSIDEFIVELDGERKRGKHIGSFDWRYFLIEKNQSQQLPLVSVDYLHEIVFGCTRIIESARNRQSYPFGYTRSWRLRWERTKKYDAWLTVRMNSNGWNELGDRLEVLWGPDYRNRYDLILFTEKRKSPRFSKIPENFPLPIIDKRKEVETFDIDKGYRSIGIYR